MPRLLVSSLVRTGGLFIPVMFHGRRAFVVLRSRSYSAQYKAPVTMHCTSVPVRCQVVLHVAEMLHVKHT